METNLAVPRGLSTSSPTQTLPRALLVKLNSYISILTSSKYKNCSSLAYKNGSEGIAKNFNFRATGNYFRLHTVAWSQKLKNIFFLIPTSILYFFSFFRLLSSLSQTLTDSHHPHPQTFTDSSTSSLPPPKLTHHHRNGSRLCLLVDRSGYRSWLCLLMGFSFGLLDFRVAVPHRRSSSPLSLIFICAGFPSTHPFRWPTLCLCCVGDFWFCL